jgi:hypothetical protein
MNDLEKVLQDAPWNSDLLAQAIAKRFPGVRHADTAEQVASLAAKGYRLRAVARNPFFPDRVVPHLYLSPATLKEQQARGIGSGLADMVSGEDMRRAGLRR